MISSILSTPSPFSILAITGIYGEPHSFSHALISRIHSAFLTNEAAIKSISCSTPNRISSLSFSVIAGRRMATPGTFTPFFSPSSPPLSTIHLISLSVLPVTFSSISPSSIKIMLPTTTSSISPAYVIDTPVSSPIFSSMLSVNALPSFSITFLPSFSCPVLISGPLVSSRIAIGFFSCSRSSFN